MRPLPSSPSSSILRSTTPLSRTSGHRQSPLIRHQSAWAAAVDSAKNLLNDSQPPPTNASGSSGNTGTSSASSTLKSLLPKGASAFLPSSKPKSPSIIRDPLSLVSSELSSLRTNVTSLLGSGHPSLDTIAKYYFQAEGKHVRPLIVLLMAKATNGLSGDWEQIQQRFTQSGDRKISQREFSERKESGKSVELDCGIDEPLSPREVLNDFNPHMESIEGNLNSSSTRDTSVQSTLFSTATSTSTGTNSTSSIFPSTSTTTIGSYPILPTQRRLAEITEMIHVASLLHDDVIDASELRRSSPSAPTAFGNKLSILGGDFLLGRASVALARLRNNEVVELLATVIANLVEGEVMQLKSQSQSTLSNGSSPTKSIFSSFWKSGNPGSEADASKNHDQQGGSQIGGLEITRSSNPSAPTPELFENYLQKTYLKTAALIGKSARASVILGGNGSDESPSSSSSASTPSSSSITPHVSSKDLSKQIRDCAYSYGRNLGISFQLVDDLLDFKSTSLAFGKPSGGADLRLGLATAPVLYAWEEIKDAEGLRRMKEMVERKFEGKGDVEKVLKIVNESNGLARTANLARHHAKLATDALEVLPESEARDALIQLTEQVLTRAK